MRSLSTSALGQPSETNETRGAGLAGSEGASVMGDRLPRAGRSGKARLLRNGGIMQVPRLVPHLDPAMGQKFLDIPPAQGKPLVQPDRMPDHRRQEFVPRVGDRWATPLLQVAVIGPPWRQIATRLTAPMGVLSDGER